MERTVTGTLSDGQIKDLKVILEFVHLYCISKHPDRELTDVQLPPELMHTVTAKRTFCRECADLLLYGIQKRMKCPLDPKPTCRKCHVHCYSGEYRGRIREIMAYSGRRMIMRGRLDYLWHYYF